MPAPGDQHRANVANPFEEAPPRMSEYTAQEIATLQSRLEKQLGPEYISSRAGPSGQKVHYLAAEKCIGLANEVFGFNGWSSSIRDVQVDFVDESTTTGKISLGLSVIVRVTLRDGSYHEDIGYGHIENCKGKAPAFEKAKKEGTTDALKRTLRNFGNILGNCVYDKEYLSKVTKMKIAPTKWDPENLHRHADYAPIRKEAAQEIDLARTSDSSRTVSADDLEDEFGNFDEADFSVAETGHPDEVALPAGRVQPPSRPAAVQQGGPNRTAPLPGNAGGRSYAQPPQHSIDHLAAGPQRSIASPNHSVQNYQNRSGPIIRAPATATAAPSAGPARVLPQATPNLSSDPPSAILSTIAHELGEYKHDPTVGFCKASAAERLQGGDSSVLAAAAFDPKLDSPSLRKTQGVDHSVSKPLQRPHGSAPAAAALGPAVGTGPAAGTRSGGAVGGFVNPHLDPQRRVGMPTSSASPLQNRSTYKPPSMVAKRGTDGTAETRPPLGDLTAAANARPAPTGEAKRVKTDGGSEGATAAPVTPGQNAAAK